MKKFWQNFKLPFLKSFSLRWPSIKRNENESSMLQKVFTPIKGWWQQHCASNTYFMAAKKWWENLGSREQRTLTWGSVAVAVLAYAFLFWQPIHNKIDELQARNQTQRELLVWMRQAEKKLKRSQKASNKKRVKVTDSLLTTVDNSIKQNKLSDHVSQIKKIDNKQVQIKFKEVGFKNLMTWLQRIQSQYLITIAKTTMRRTEKPGMAQVELVLAKES